MANERFLNNINSDSQQPASMMTFKGYVENRFVPQFVAHKKHAGQLHYAYILETHLLPMLGDLRLRDIDNETVQKVINIKAKSFSSQTVKHIRNVIRKVFAHARSRKAFSVDLPTCEVELPEMKSTRQVHAMDFEQVMTLLGALEQRSSVAYAMVLLSVCTSMNIAEMLGLRNRRINLTESPMMIDGRLVDGPSVSVRENCYRGVFGTVKAKCRIRDIPIGKPVVDAISRVRQESGWEGPEDLLFATDKGTPLDEKNLMRRIIKPIATRLGMPWMGWHVLRHTHATLAERIGMAMADRQAGMGHAGSRMTMLYTHEDIKRRRTALDHLADRIALPASSQNTRESTNDTKRH